MSNTHTYLALVWYFTVVIMSVAPGSFTLFTALGAGIWTAILAAAGYAIGRSTADIGYLELCTRGKAAVSAHLPLVIGVALALAAVYILVSKLVMRSDGR